MLDLIDREASLELAALGLNAPQADTLVSVARCGVVSAPQVMTVTGRSRQETYDALNYLVSRSWLKREGRKPNTKYSLEKSIFSIIKDISDEESKHHLEMVQRIANVVHIFEKDLETD